MCDTLVAVSGTVNNSIIFGKNSDRDPNEVQNIVHIPRMQQNSDLLNTTYIQIPQVKETYEVLLSKPFWMWGAEMGSNEHNVVIGNEAVYTKENLEKEALLGMDLLRLALERCKTALESLELIVNLLDEFGQGGECGYTRKATYHNSFIIADPNEAWVLETAGRYWIAEKVTSIRTISNCLTIGKEYDKIHPELLSHTIEKGYCKDDSDFHFADNYNTKFMTWAARGNTRRACTLNELSENHGNLNEVHFMKALRLHNLESRKFFPPKSSMSMPCLHASSFQTPSQSTASQVTKLSKSRSISWLTGTSGTCTSIYKPFILGVKNYATSLQVGKSEFDKQSLWWRHERLHRLTMKNYNKLHPVYSKERDEFELEMIQAINDESLSPLDVYDKSVEYIQISNKKEFDWFIRVKKEYENLKNFTINPYKIKYNRFWNKWNKKAKIDFNIAD